MFETANEINVAIWDNLSKRILNSNVTKTYLPITNCSVVKSFWKFAQSMAWSVQNFKTNWQIKWILWTKEISWNLKLRWVSDKYHILQQPPLHNIDVIMSATASQIFGVSIVYSTVYSGADQRKHGSSASLAFVRGIHWRPVNSPHKGPVTQNIFPFNDVIMILSLQITMCCTARPCYTSVDTRNKKCRCVCQRCRNCDDCAGAGGEGGSDVILGAIASGWGKFH